MKKYLVIAAIAMMAAVNVNAQNENLRHELSLSYGLGSIAQFGDGLGEGLALAIFSDTEYDNGFILGPISAEYFYHFNNPRLAIGPRAIPTSAAILRRANMKPLSHRSDWGEAQIRRHPSPSRGR